MGQCVKQYEVGVRYATRIAFMTKIVHQKQPVFGTNLNEIKAIYAMAGLENHQPMYRCDCRSCRVGRQRRQRPTTLRGNRDDSR